MTDYEKQAADFAERNKVKMTSIYLGHYPRFSNHVVANYRITLTREGKKPFMFDFSTSINNSWQYQETGVFKFKEGLPPRIDLDKFFSTIPTVPIQFRQYTINHKKKAPSLYDVLACLTKYNPGTFADFCADYGYSDDSMSAFNTYQAVVKEYGEVNAMFADVIDELAEIN